MTKSPHACGWDNWSCKARVDDATAALRARIADDEKLFDYAAKRELNLMAELTTAERRLKQAVTVLREIAHAHAMDARGLRFIAADALIAYNAEQENDSHG